MQTAITETHEKRISEINITTAENQPTSLVPGVFSRVEKPRPLVTTSSKPVNVFPRVAKTLVSAGQLLSWLNRVIALQ